MDIISIAIAKKGAKIYTDTIAATKADKANTYTKAEVDKKLADVIQYTVVEELPETGSEGVIYLLPNGGEAPNVYDEYIWNTEPPKWEKIGTTEIDLTPYYQKTEVNELLDRDLAGNAKEMGDYFAEKLATIPHVKEVRHQGLLVGVEFDDSISGVDVKHGCIDRKLLITAIGDHIIRMIPPLIVSKEDCDKAVAIISETVSVLS